MSESEGDRMCGFALRPDEAVQFYHRGQTEFTPAQLKSARTFNFIVSGVVGLYFLWEIFSGGLDGFISQSAGFMAALIAVILIIRWLLPIVYLRRRRRKKKNWGQVAITNQRLLLRELVTGQMREIERNNITSSALDFKQGSRVVSVTVKDALNAPIILEVAKAIEAHAALNAD